MADRHLVTLADVTAAFRRLRAVFRQRQPEQPQEYLAEYLAALKRHRITARELDDAVGSYLAESTGYFPKPGDLWNLIRASRSDRGTQLTDAQRCYLAWYRTGMYGACPVCGAKLDFRTGQRSSVWHDAEQHRAAGVGYHGHAASTALTVPAEQETF